MPRPCHNEPDVTTRGTWTGRLRIDSVILPMWTTRPASYRRRMFNSPAAQRVQVTFVGTPPTSQIERASGVTETEVDGHTVRCLVCGSFQPLLEAVRGYEVISLTSIPAPSSPAH